jgi:hypothetical protein
MVTAFRSASLEAEADDEAAEEDGGATEGEESLLHPEKHAPSARTSAKANDVNDFFIEELPSFIKLDLII